jgi:23S rRNA (cytosine1962-C5)-methyltransferase
VLGRRFIARAPEELAAWVASGSSFVSLVAFRQRLLDAAALRYPLLVENEVFRVVNGQGDGLPGVVIDHYAGRSVLAVSTADAEASASEIAQCLVEHGVNAVYLKRRERRDLRRAATQELAPPIPIARASEAPECGSLAVREGGLRTAVELGDGLSTGLFVDQRENRGRVRECARGKQVLNLFSYTCSFSVAAALGGAARVTSVDLAGRALERGRQNFRLNGLDPELHEFVQGDAARFSRDAVKSGRRFGLIVLDPPSFATVGRATFRFERDALELVADCLRLLTDDGALLCVTNHQKTSLQGLRRIVQGAAQRTRASVRIRDLTSGLDCPPGLEGPSPSKSVWVEHVVSARQTP